MRRSSPMANPRRLPSPSSSSESGAPAAGFHHSRSLPSNPIPPADPAEDQSGRAFRRAVSDRVRQAGEGMQVPAPMEEDRVVSPRRSGQRRKKAAEEQAAAPAGKVGRVASKSPRRLRYDRVSRSEDQGRGAVFSPLRRSKTQVPEVTKEKSNGNVGADEGQGEVLRKSWSSPVNVKVEPEEMEVDTAQHNTQQKGSKQLKQKAADLFASLPTSFSFSRSSTPSSSPQPARLRRSLERAAEQDPKDEWVPFLLNLIMWRDFSRSTLCFGSGAFLILSASFMQDMHFNVVTVMSYLALTYLSAVFFSTNILQRLPPSGNDAWKLNEAAVVQLTRQVLPAVNAVLLKLSVLFSGDPKTTLKVATVLWCLAHAGYWMSLWNMFRLAFFGAFLIPRAYVAYSAQLQQHGNHLVSHLLSAWDGCSHKKAVAIGALVLLWNVSTFSTRLWFAFFSLVTLRQYQMSHSPAESNAPGFVTVKNEH